MEVQVEADLADAAAVYFGDGELRFGRDAEQEQGKQGERLYEGGRAEYDSGSFLRAEQYGNALRGARGCQSRRSVGRVRRSYRYDPLPSEPCVPLSPHTAQANSAKVAVSDCERSPVSGSCLRAEDEYLQPAPHMSLIYRLYGSLASFTLLCSPCFVHLALFTLLCSSCFVHLASFTLPASAPFQVKKL